MGASLKERAYSHIRRKVLAGEYVPGTQLSHRDLAKEIGMSFTPVRDAMNQLVSEGLIQRKARVGTFVTELSREELEELYEVREAMECHALGKAFERLTKIDLAHMQRCNDELTAIVNELHGSSHGWSQEQVHRWLRADAEFHLTLLRAAGNRRIMKIVSDSRVMARIFARRGEAREICNARTICKEHQTIVDALLAGDSVSAQRVMGQHIQHGCKSALVAYDRQRADTAAGRSFETETGELLAEIHNLELTPE